MKARHKLTHHAILYSSVGFQQKAILQVLSIRSDHSTFQMVLYDGMVYAGANYLLSSHSNLTRNDPKNGKNSDNDSRKDNRMFEMAENRKIPRQLDLIQVTLKLAGNKQPLYIYNYEDKGLTQPLGKEILSLEEYMKRRKFIQEIEIRDESPEKIPSKKVKGDLSHGSTSPKSSKNNQNIENEEMSNSKLTFVQNQLKQVNIPDQKEVQDLKQSKIRDYQEELAESRVLINSITIESKDSLCQEPQQNKQTSNFDEIKQATVQQNNIASENEKVIEVKQDEDLIRKFLPKKNKPKIIDLIDDPEQKSVTQIKSTAQLINNQKPNVKPEMMIEDLYERMHRFKILCRINHISHFKSQKGTQCTKIMLIDEKGDEVLCMLLEKQDQVFTNNSPLHKGRTYFFQNGEVEKDGNGFLTVILHINNMQITKVVLPSFHPSKVMRVGELENITPNYFFQKSMNSNNKSINNKKSHSKELHVCGIFKGHRDESKLINNQFRVSGILCDPDRLKSINFTLFVDELSTFPSSGTVLTLHNMHIIENEGTYRLEQSKRSYYIIENHNSHKYFQDLNEASKSESWKLKEYSNLSQVRYVPRTIEELKQLLSRILDQDQCFSQIDCNIASITEIKEFSACAQCRGNITKNAIRSYCYQCKKIQYIIKRFIFEAQVADSTGSIFVKIFSEEIENFINIVPEDYAKMSQFDRKTYLQQSTYRNILLKVKSQKQGRAVAHVVSKAEKIVHNRGLQQIREQQIAERTTYQPSWL